MIIYFRMLVFSTLIISCTSNKRCVHGLRKQSSNAGKHNSPEIRRHSKAYVEHFSVVTEAATDTLEIRKSQKYNRYKRRHKAYSYMAVASGGFGFLYPPSWLITIPTTIIAINAGRKMNGVKVFETNHLHKIKEEERMTDTAWVDVENYNGIGNLPDKLKYALEEKLK